MLDTFKVSFYQIFIKEIYASLHFALFHIYINSSFLQLFCETFPVQIVWQCHPAGYFLVVFLSQWADATGECLLHGRGCFGGGSGCFGHFNASSVILKAAPATAPMPSHVSARSKWQLVGPKWRDMFRISVDQQRFLAWNSSALQKTLLQPQERQCLAASASEGVEVRLCVS